MKVLAADDDADREQWLDYWEACGREPHAHPAYCSLFLGPGERAVAIALASPEGRALLPLVLRPLPWGADGVDAVSPYGYGGPYTTGSFDPEDVVRALERWAPAAGICSVFLRLSLAVPLAARSTPEHQVVHISDNVVVDVRREPDHIWTAYEHKVRKNVKKAQRAGCSVRRDEGFVDLDGFSAVYTATMQRRGAADWFHFDRELFARLERELKGSMSVFSVLAAEGQTVSVELVLESDRYLYSFLGGTLEKAFPMAPNDLLKHEVVLHGQRSGRRGYVLGGGYTAGDGIFRYKRAFDPTGVVPFRGLCLVGDPDHYADLVAMWAGRQNGALPATGYFPAYRAPLSLPGP